VSFNALLGTLASTTVLGRRMIIVSETRLSNTDCNSPSVNDGAMEKNEE
jgi:hypothetical protein